MRAVARVPARLAVLGACLLGAAGCGESKHEALLASSDPLVTVEALDSKPTGELLPVPGRPVPGDRWGASLQVTERVKRTRGDRVLEDKGLRGTWTIEQDFSETDSNVRFRFEELSGSVHVEGGSPQLHVAPSPKGDSLPVLTFTTSREAEEVLLGRFVRGLELAGFGGSTPWLPSRPVREGESWDVVPLMHPRALARMRSPREVEGVGPETAEVTAQARVEEVIRDAAGLPTALRLRLELGLVLNTTITAEKRTTPMRTRHRLRGNATISLANGLPTEVDIAYVERVAWLDEVYVQERAMRGKIDTAP